ncbi:TPA: type 1 fimbrial protein [Escherichia coli]|nr:type 1 fimbrial protein [Escherichia coli]
MNSIYSSKQIEKILTILFVLLSNGASAATDTYNTTVTIDIPQPTCSVSVPAEVQLGTLTPGMKINRLPDFTIQVDCGSYSVKHAVYMLSSNTLSSNNDGIFLKQEDNSDTDIILKIKGTNGNSKFTDDEQNPVLIHEGKNSGSINYPTKISVDMPDKAKPGKVRGSVIFKLTYPA